MSEPTTCTPRSFPNGDKECRQCGAFAAAGEQLICRQTGFAAVELEKTQPRATGTNG